MWIARTARGRAGTRRLIDACADWAAAHGIRELELGVFAANERARRAYAAVGFAVVERRMWTGAGRELELLVMRRPA